MFDIPGLMRRFNEQVIGDGYQQIQNLDYLPPQTILTILTP